MNGSSTSRVLLTLTAQRVSPASSRFSQPIHRRCGLLNLTTERKAATATYVPCQRRFASHQQTAQDLNQKGIDQQLSEYDRNIAEEQDKQRRAPWHREGSQEPPVRRQRSAGAMTKVDINTDRKDVAPLALLVHPSQPLSYLSRLIQSELPTVPGAKGVDRPPEVSFRAVESKDDETPPSRPVVEEGKGPNDPEDTEIGEGAVQSYSGAGRESETDSEGEFIRWSSSTEIGDFIRDAARAKEFEVEIEGNPETIKVAVPSFNDRTFYLRQRLRRMATTIADMATLKHECDAAAHKTGQRVRLWDPGRILDVVYRLTFETDLGWDVMEPVTYLVGLSTLIGGYMWFLYHNREVSYRSAMNLTVSRRQSKLYEQRGFNLQKWEALIEEANAIRKEVKAVASEYDVQWDEMADEKDPRVTKALRDERRANQKRSGKKKDKDEEEEDDD
ncbi:hypothetical protein LTR51_005481 [Lithohypha guttulata]|nr:hypothetical protein LTR51_005481 [Lithohypha guttulata]